MTYQEILERARKFDIPAWQLLAANEVNCQFEDLSSEDFELLSDFVYDWIMDTAMPVDELCRLIKDCLEDEVFTLDDIKNDPEFVRDELNERI